jgi:hypothetical protein
MRAGVAFAAAMTAGLAIGTAQAASIPYSLGGTWICTFKNGDKATIVARAGRPGVQFQYNAGDITNLWVSNTADGGINSHGDGWAWTLTPKDGAAVMVWDSTAKGQTYTVPCAKK